MTESLSRLVSLLLYCVKCHDVPLQSLFAAPSLPLLWGRHPFSILLGMLTGEAFSWVSLQEQSSAEESHFAQHYTSFLGWIDKKIQRPVLLASTQDSSAGSSHIKPMGLAEAFVETALPFSFSLCSILVPSLSPQLLTPTALPDKLP